MAKSSRLRRAQIDKFFSSPLKPQSIKVPKDGWIREVRNALSMSMQDLASRLGVIRQRVERIEKDELEGKLTLETMRRTAEALNCELVYFLLPKQPLEETFDEQATAAAKAIVRSVDRTMSLEKQKTALDAQKSLIEEIKQELMSKEDRRIWRPT